MKVDGLPYDTVDRFVHERDPQTGKSRLPWFDYIFYQNGARLTNFYVRGMSLSAPSWSLIDTGQHLQIKGNVEFDRYIFHTYDYLNFVPFYFKQAYRGNVDMPGTEVIDSLGLHLLMDAYDNYQRLPGSQLYGRGARLATLQRAGQAEFGKNPIQLAEEFLTGLDLRNAVFGQYERELIDSLGDPRVQYLDLFDMSYDHAAHHTNDDASHLQVLRELDARLGRFWTAIQKSPLAGETIFIVVSDHGFNSDPKVLSQGFNLVKLLGSREGGAHHVITKRRLMMDYAIKGINPFVPPITTTTSQSYYLKGQSTDYPTALLDFDGNERAGLHLRNTDLNELHILLQQLQRKDLSPELRTAATNTFFAVIARDRAAWVPDLDQLEKEIGALHRAIEAEDGRCKSQPKKFTDEDREMGRDDNARRTCLHVTQWTELETHYAGYIATMRALLALNPDTLQPAKLQIPEFIPRSSMGQRNTVYALQNYIVGLGPSGLVLNGDGSLDLDRTFVRLNYYDLLKRQTVRNNVQPGISNQPVDFLATRIPREAIAALLPPEAQPDDDVIWLYAGPERQALLLARGEANGQLQLRYLPIANLTQDASGTIHFDRINWQSDLPLKILEDARLETPEGDRTKWLNDWHTDVEWLRALHKTQYSNGLIGLHEQFMQFVAPATDVNAKGISEDERLLRSLRRRQRHLAETDLQIFANNHWNFDVRGFNPGGNHGSFFRISTHATFMLAGDGVPRGLAVTDPYDSLSVVPTILALTGNLQSDSTPAENLVKRGFIKFPGRVITEITGQQSGAAHSQ
ncbi:MAG TPA: alkaline phosphatase family protein [Pyrinomonadaceae bacterium]|nr:alkaline phosphatase family protein [Pyrinomonadaceae bacterium]